jgi:hypothetical protein
MGSMDSRMGAMEDRLQQLDARHRQAADSAAIAAEDTAGVLHDLHDANASLASNFGEDIADIREMASGALNRAEGLETHMLSVDDRVSAAEQAVTDAKAAIYRNTTEVNPRLLMLEKKWEDQQSQIAQLKEQIKDESRKRDNLEANSRLYNLEIGGLPNRGQGDDSMRLARKLVETLSDVPGSAIDVAHRKAGGNIIMRFKTRSDRDRVWAKREGVKRLTRRDFDYPSTGKVYLNESLTFDRSKLMRDFREKVRVANEGRPFAEQWRVFTDKGNIKLRSPTSPRPTYHKLESMEDLVTALGL